MKQRNCLIVRRRLTSLTTGVLHVIHNQFNQAREDPGADCGCYRVYCGYWDLSLADQEVQEELHHVEQNLMISANRAEIWRAKREIKRLQRERTKEDNNITDIMLIDADIKEFEGLVDCIRDGKELCY